MNWNYRIIKYEDQEGYGLHEIYYEDDRAVSRTENPIIACGNDEGPDGIIKSLKMALNDVENKPYLKDSEIGSVDETT